MLPFLFDAPQIHRIGPFSRFLEKRERLARFLSVIQLLYLPSHSSLADLFPLQLDFYLSEPLRRPHEKS